MKARLDFRLTDDEYQLLSTYCEAVGRTKSDVLRELIRKLTVHQLPSSTTLKDGVLNPIL